MRSASDEVQTKEIMQKIKMRNLIAPIMALIVAVAIISLGIAITVAWFYEGDWAAIGTCVSVGGFILAVGTVTYMAEAYDEGKAEAEYQEFKNRDKGRHPFGYLKHSTGGAEVVRFTNIAVLEMAVAGGDLAAYGFFSSHEEAEEEFTRRYSVRVHYLVPPSTLV